MIAKTELNSTPLSQWKVFKLDSVEIAAQYCRQLWDKLVADSPCGSVGLAITVNLSLEESERSVCIASKTLHFCGTSTSMKFYFC